MSTKLIKVLTRHGLMDHQGQSDDRVKPVSKTLNLALRKICRTRSSILENRFIVEDDQVKMSYWWVYQVIKTYLALTEAEESSKPIKSGKNKLSQITVFLGILPIKCYPPEMVSQYSVELTCGCCNTVSTCLPGSIKGDPRGVDLLLRQITSYLYQ